MPIQVPDQWIPHFDAVLADPGVTVVLGDIDMGKTSLCALLANRAVEARIPTAVVDGDIGQSELGPPTTVGLGIVESEIQALRDIHARKLYFVGSTTPVGQLLPEVVGVKKLTEEALSLGSRLVIVDTTGLIRGLVGRRLKTHKIELLSARHIIALQRSDEAEHILKFFDTWKNCTVHRLRVAPEARPKSPAIRAQRRAVHFRTYFKDGQQKDVSLADITTSGTWLRSGNPLEPRYLKFAEKALGTGAYYGERIGRQIFLIMKSDYVRKGMEEVQQEFGTKSIEVVPASRYLNLLVGLMDEHLDLLSLGIIQAIDYRTQTASIYTPLRSLSPVKSIRFGALKVRADGTEIGRMRPGDV